jgi:hypothetical protein
MFVKSVVLPAWGVGKARSIGISARSFLGFYAVFTVENSNIRNSLPRHLLPSEKMEGGESKTGKKENVFTRIYRGVYTRGPGDILPP